MCCRGGSWAALVCLIGSGLTVGPAAGLARAQTSAAPPAAGQPQPGTRPGAPGKVVQAPANPSAAPAAAAGEQSGATKTPTDADLRAQLEQATAEYAAAFNARDYTALSNQWTAGALLVEGGGQLVGREQIIQSIGAWAGRYPEAKLEIALTGVMPLGATIARVRGTMRFVPKPGARAVDSQFVSLRVRVDGKWRLAESIVTPSQDVAMEQLGWLLGTWIATAPDDGAVLECRYERAADGHVIIGRTKITPKEGAVLESVDVIHADAASGTVRSWVFDSTGARAEGVFETDGTVFNRVYQGTAAPGSAGTRTSWVQMVVPTDRDTLVMQAIERSLDGRPVPDGRPWHLKRKP